ncbi:MAG: hypothetical protein ACE366_23230 [Bradymonadia bacterium]
MLRRFAPTALLIFTSFALSAGLSGCVEDSSPTTDVEGDALLDAEIIPDTEVPDAEVPDAAVPDAEIVPDAEPMGAPCTEDSECEEGAVCGDDGFCTEPECRMDGDCGNQLQLCRFGLCLDRCLGPGTCFRGGICIDGACEPPQCEEDKDCDVGEVCRDQQCIPAQPCEDNDQCPEDTQCLDGNCEPLPPCGGDRNCAPNEICEAGLCRPQAECESRDACLENEDCIGGRCVPFICRGDADCPEAQVCNAGACEAPAMAEVERIVILTPPRTLVTGQSITLQAVGLDLRGDIVQVRGFTWFSDRASVLQVDRETGVAIAGATLGTVGVTAQLGEGADLVLSNQVDFTVVEAADPEIGQVRVTDAATGLPVEGASVRVGDETTVTDATGIVLLGDVEPPITVTVFSPDHDYVTVVGANRSDLHIPLTPRRDDSVVAGFTGAIDFARITSEGGVDVGLAGGSIGGAGGEVLTGLDLGTLLGQLFNVEVDVGITAFDLPLPGGLTLTAEVPLLGRVEIKDGYRTISDPGFRMAWSFAGRLDLGQIIQLVQGGGGTDVGTVLATVLPFFDRFQHGLRVVDDLVALPQRPDETDIDRDGDLEELVPDYDRFPVLNTQPAQDQGLRLTVQVPPPSAGEGTPIALLLAGVSLQSVGFVPLGLSSTTEAEAVAMRMAPPYGGLEAGEPVVLALSAAFGQDQGGLLPENISMLFAQFEDRIPGEVSFEGDGFLDLPSAVEWAPALRTLEALPADGAGFHRAVFRGGEGRWTVYFAPGADVAFTLPFPPDGAADLAAGDQVRVEGLDLTEGVDFDALVGDGGPGDLTDLDRMVRRLSRAVDL